MVTLIALVESPQVCSLKFLTCERWSVYRLTGACGGSTKGFGGGVVVAESVGLAVEVHQWNANRLWLTHVSGGVAVGLLGRLGVVVAGRGRCGAGSGRASR